MEKENLNNRLHIVSILLLLLTNTFLGRSACDTLSFLNRDISLIGYFYPSSVISSPTLIFTQGFMETGDIWNLGETLSANGINVFMFDFSGCFDSGGQQGLKNSQQDIGSAIKFLKSEQNLKKYNIDTTKIVLGGYSYGGHMSMLYAINHSEIKRVISISGGDLGIFGDLLKSDPELLKGYSFFFQSIKKPNGPVDFEYDDPIQELIGNQEYFYILRQTDSLSNVNILLTGGLDDNVVNMENYILPLYRKLKNNMNAKIDLKVYQTDHSYNNVSDTLIEDLIYWIKNN